MHPATFRLITWNINARTWLDNHLKLLAELKPDVVALQEVRETAIEELRQGLAALGLTSFTECATLAEQEGADRAQVIASRWPIRAGKRVATPYPHSVLSAVVTYEGREVELYNAHVPNGSNHGWTKIATYEKLYAHLAHASERPRILCGDFNAPHAELPDGRLITWAYDKTADGYERWKTWTDRAGKRDTAERWDTAERGIFEGLATFDLPDVFRQLNGYGVEAASWHRRRYDHVFASRSLSPASATYRKIPKGLSDHLPLEVEFAPAWGSSTAG